VRFSLGTCGVLEVMRQALVNAGPNLTDRTLMAGIQKIRGLEATTWPSVSYGPGKYWGEDAWEPMTFHKAGCPPLGEHFCSTGPPVQFWVP
jgi:hypothetical protein